METIKFKFIASQPSSIYHYKKLEIKVLKCNADIYFNKKCVAKKPDDGRIRPKHVANYPVVIIYNLYLFVV